jgi:hypothetical protein
VEERKEKNLETYKRIKNTSTVALVVSLILVINLIIVLSDIHIVKTIIYDMPLVVRLMFVLLTVISCLFLLPLFATYFFSSAVYAYIKHQKIHYIDIAAIATIGIFYTLYFTGFCFKDMRYWSKAEIIDKMLSSYIEDNCYAEYRVKHGGMTHDSKTEAKAIKECSISLESVKKEAPQCFTMFRPNRCSGNVTHFDKDTNSFIKSEIEVYWYGRLRRRIDLNSEYLRFFVESELHMYGRYDGPVIGCCGTIKYGVWG